MSAPERSLFTPIRGLVKLLALVVGGAVSLLALVAVLGLWIEALWLRVVLGVAALLLVPLPVADRALPRENTEPAKGIISDVIAIVWMCGALVVAAVGPTLLKERLDHEATWLTIRGLPRVGWFARWLAHDGAPPPAPAPVAEPAPAPEPAPSAEPTPTETPPATADNPDTTSPEKPPDPPPETPPAPATTEPEPPKELTPAELFTAYAPAVVTIRTESLFGSGAGTGFFVDDSGLIATNHHVIDGGAKLTVKRFDGSETDKVEIVDQDPERDLALLKIEATDTLPAVKLGDSEAITVGEAVIVIGNPLGLEHTLTDGLVSSRRLLRDKRFIQMSAPVSPGNSGGPVFNRRGEVIGVTVAKLAMGFGENLNLAIPVNDLKTLLARDHAKGKRGGSSW